MLIGHKICAASSHEHLYVNGRSVTCPQLSSFIQDLHSQACAGLHRRAPRQRKPPLPTWVLLLECPRSAVDIASYEPHGPVIELVDELGLLAGVRTALLTALESQRPSSGEPQREVAHRLPGSESSSKRFDVGSGGSVEPQRMVAHRLSESETPGKCRSVGPGGGGKQRGEVAHLPVSSSYLLQSSGGSIKNFPVRKTASRGGSYQGKAEAESSSFVASLSNAAQRRQGIGAKAVEDLEVRSEGRGTKRRAAPLQAFAYHSQTSSTGRKQESKGHSASTRFSAKQAELKSGEIARLPASWSSAPMKERSLTSKSGLPQTQKPVIPEKRSSQIPKTASKLDPGLRAAKPTRSHAASPSLLTPWDSASRKAAAGAKGGESPPAERPSLAALLRGWKNPCIAYSKPITQLRELVQVRR